MKKEGADLKLMIVGTGAMGKTLAAYAEDEGTFSEIIAVEPATQSDDTKESKTEKEKEKEKISPQAARKTEEKTDGKTSVGFPAEKVDLIIDFSHPQAIYGIYEYCREQGGNIPVVLATTGYGKEEEEIIRLLEKICPTDRRSNYSQGVAAMMEMAVLGKKLLGNTADIRVFETHHTKKQDSPSGTAKSLCNCLEISAEEYAEKTACLRMGTVFGEHSVYFAMEDEVLEIRHSAFSKKIFAAGALAAGKKMLSCKNRDFGV